MNLTTIWTAVGPLVGTIVGGLIAHFVSKSHRQWIARETHYIELLNHLGKAHVALEEQGEYFQEPGSEHHDVSNDERYRHLGSIVHEALIAVRELTGAARIFLSRHAVDALEELGKAKWHADWDFADQKAYVGALLQAIEAAEKAIRAAAKAQLKV